jgi:hypothetical protein
MISEPSEQKINNYTFAFYNLENLFDTKDDPLKLDDDFTEKSERKWNRKRFDKKVRNLGNVIRQIGFRDIQHPPVLVGVAEVENAFVLRQLIESEYLKDKGYSLVHFDSPDERGIDTALIYRPAYFKILKKKAIALNIFNEFGVRDFTRDILHIEGMLEGEIVHILVNHWPSRRAGVEETRPKRMAAASKNREIIAGIMDDNPDARIVLMGDLNADPKSESVQHLVGTSLYNPMEMLHTRYSGSLRYRGNWNLFDQIILTNNFLQQHGNSFRFVEAKIFDAENLKEFKGKRRGNPFRTFLGRRYHGGISDHFPVYGIFSIHSKD